MERMGSGFDLTNIPTIEIDSGDPDIGILTETEPSALKEAKKIMEKIKLQRGDIISLCVDIDSLLIEGISNFFLEKDPEKRQIFQDLILDTTFLSLGQKKNILKLIIEKYPQNFGLFSIKKERNKFFKHLDYIIKYRNALAHGRIIINYNENIITLQYYNSNKNEMETTSIDSSFFYKLHNTINDTILEFYTGFYNNSQFVVSHIEITEFED
jgi:hypothetical protein